MTRPALLLRLMAELGSAAEAEDQARRAAARLGAYGAVTRRAVERYWKIPEYWEITLRLDPADPAPAVFRRLLALAEGGWTVGGDDEDPWAVWNAAPGVRLLTPEVRWAEVRVWR